MTRFHWITSAFLAVALGVLLGTAGLWRVGLLAALCTAYGLGVGLGVSFPQWHWFGRALCRIPTQRPIVVLTFDDGPAPETTGPLLDLLDRRGIRATFFCVGRAVESHPQLARRIHAAGHGLENHTHRHRWNTNLYRTTRLRRELEQAQETVGRTIGTRPTLFRPPMGLTNLRVFRAARDLDLTVVGWTARGFDRRRHSPERIVGRLLKGLRPGAIFQLHDAGVPPARLLSTVDMLIDKLEALGYQCRPLHAALTEPNEL